MDVTREQKGSRSNDGPLVSTLRYSLGLTDAAGLATALYDVRFVAHRSSRLILSQRTVLFVCDQTNLPSVGPVVPPRRLTVVDLNPCVYSLHARVG